MNAGLDEPFRFKFNQMVRVVGDHPKSGQRGRVDGMPGSDELLYGVVFEAEGRGSSIPEASLTEDTNE